MAATVIDSLIVELGLDPADFTRGGKDAAQSLVELKRTIHRHAKDAEDDAKGIGEGLDAVMKGALGFMTSVLGIRGLGQFAANLVETSRAMGVMADVTGESVTRLHALAGVFERLGGSAQGVLNVIGQWDRELKQMALQALDPNQSKLILLLRDLGSLGVKVTATDAQGRWRKPVDILIEIDKRIRAAGVGERRHDLTVAVLQAAGIDDQTIKVMLETGKTLEQHIADQKDIAELTEEQRKKNDEIRAKYETLIQRTKSLGQIALVELAGGFEKVLDVIRRLATFVGTELTDPKSAFFLPSLQKIKDYFGVGTRGTTFRPGIGTGRGREGGGPGVGGYPTEGTPGKSGANYLGSSRAAAAGVVSGVGQNLVTVQTAAGAIVVNKDASEDLAGAVNDLVAAGAPVGNIGSYSNRRIAGSGRMSQHSMGGAMDLFSQSGKGIISPQGMAWLRAHPEEWKAIKRKRNLVGGEEFGDVGHVEWGGKGFGEAHYGPNAVGQRPAAPTGSGSTSTPPRASAIPFLNFGSRAQAATVKPGPTVTRNEAKSVTVNTQAKDAAAIAQDVARELRKEFNKPATFNERFQGAAP